MNYEIKVKETILQSFLLSSIVFLLTGYLLFCIGTVATVVNAQETPSYSESSLGISPAILELILTPGIETDTEIVVFNSTKFPLPIKSTVESFIANESFIGSETIVSHDVFDSSSWFSVEPEDFIIQPNEEKVVTVKVFPPENAEPGGHYATIFFQPLIPEAFLSESATNLTTKVGALALSIVSGDIVESAEVASIEVPKLNQYGPVSLGTPITNTGNVHLLPSGSISIENMFTHKTTELAISPGTVLPKTQRVFKVDFGSKLMFGRFKALSHIKYGSSNKDLFTEETEFWVIPWILILVVITMLTGGILLYTIIGKNVFAAWNVLLGRADSADITSSKRKKSRFRSTKKTKF